MARSGTIYLFGDGKLKSTPIHGEDLAIECVNAIDNEISEFEIGGPQTLSQNEIPKIAFVSTHKKPKIVHIPDWIRKVILKTVHVFMNEKKFGPIEFFITVMSMDMASPEYGKHSLSEYYDELYQAD